jgi:hypothetical protein
MRPGRRVAEARSTTVAPGGLGGSCQPPDSIALDDDHRRLERLAAKAVDQPCGFHHGDLGLGRTAESQDGDESGKSLH